MKFARFAAEGKTSYGIVEGNSVRRLSGTPFGRYKVTDQVYPLKQVRLLAPCTPSSVLALAINYKSHAEAISANVPAAVLEQAAKQPGVFYKVPTSIIATEETIVIPKVYKGRTDEECEVVVVIGKRCQRVSKEAALDYVLGYTAGNDVSARGWQREDRSWWRAKSSDTFSPIGPFIETDLPHDNIAFRTIINGKEMRSGNTRGLTHDIPTLISFMSQAITLNPGDIIFTGTPGAACEIRPGDVVEIDVKGVGTLRNPVRQEE